MATNGKDDDDIPPPQRPPSPPLHTTYAARAIHTPNFSAFRPRDIKIPSPHPMSHVAWSCDGKKLAAVGIDKIVRVWQPEKSMEIRAASIFSGAHADDVDHVSWNPTHPELFVSSSQKDRKIVFWDARQSRSIQQLSLKLTPTQTGYAPDGKIIFYVSAGHSLYFLELGRNPGETKDTWRIAEEGKSVVASSALFNHAGDGIVASFHSEHTLRVFDYPGLTIQENPAAHVGGCVAIAQDPRGKYIASGGHDSIVNLFDVTEWICARTITCCDHAINALSFSHDGEYLAISNTSTYIDICAVETGMPIHRVSTSGLVSTVTWHPSKHLIAFCGQTKVREGVQSPPSALVSLFDYVRSTFRLPMTSNPALIIVDLQEDFCPPNGSLAVGGGREVVPVINDLLKFPFVLKVATKDHHPPGHISFASNHENKQPFTSFATIRNPNNPDETYESRLWPDHCVVGTKGNELLEELDIDKVDLILEKGTDPRVEMYSVFRPPLTNPPLKESESGLENILKERGITDVYFVGLTGDYCVRFSAIDCARTKDAGWNTYVIEEAIRSVDPGAGWEEARAEMLDAGVKIVSVNDNIVFCIS